MRRRRIKGGVRFNAYAVIEKAVEDGASYGWHRAFKYVEDGDIPCPGEASATIADEVMNALCEVLVFDDGEGE